MPPRRCPGDQQPMQILRVAAADREVEIDRCPTCGSVWFDAGELEQVTELSAQRSAVESGAQCPGCAQPMSYARLTGELGAQICHRCHGTFVDGLVMAALKREPALPRPMGPGQPEISFECTCCGRRSPYLSSSGAGACAECVASGVAAPSADPLSAIDVAAGVLDLASLAFLVFF